MSFLKDFMEKLAEKDAALYFAAITSSICDVATKLDDRLTACGISRLSLVLIAFTLGYFISFLKWCITDHVEPLHKRIRNRILRIVRSLPPVKKYIAKEMGKARSKVDERKHADVAKTPEDQRLISAVPHLPKEGHSSEDIMARLDAYSRLLAKDGKTWKDARLSGGVYHLRADLDDLAVKVFRHQLHTNPLHFDVFGDTRRCEAELIAWIWRLYNGPADKPPCGAVTSGGTESIALAVLASRNRALERGIRWPEIVCSRTAHSAFEKSAEMFRMRVIKIDPVWPDGTINLSKMRKAITKNTCLLVASAPSFPWGCVDPVKEISDLGVRYDIPVHVDCCLGGFLVPFAVDAGFPFKHGPVDFRNKGVTTISVDTHKYGFSPKGSSLVLYRDASLRAAQLFVCSDWPGGIYATPSLAGSRSGALVVAAWASVLRVGYNGYVESTRGILRAAKQLRERIAKIPGLRLLGLGELCVVAFAMEDDSLANCIFLIFDRMTAKGWHINALQYPSGLHIALTDMHSKPGIIETFANNLEEATKETIEAIKSGKENGSMGSAAVYGTTQTIPDRTIINEFVKGVIEDALAV